MKNRYKINRKIDIRYKERFIKDRLIEKYI